MTEEQVLIDHIQEYLDSGMWQYEACYLSKSDLEVIIKALERTRWIPVSERLPEVDEDGDSDYILISLENFSFPVIGRYAIDQDGDGSFHEGDEERTLLSYGLFVNAWMPLPKPYRESE